MLGGSWRPSRDLEEGAGTILLLVLTVEGGTVLDHVRNWGWGRWGAGEPSSRAQYVVGIGVAGMQVHRAQVRWEGRDSLPPSR